MLKNQQRVTYKERDKNCGVHENQTDDGSPTVADTVGDGPGQEDTNESTALASLEEGTLPLRFDSPLVGSHLNTVSFLESAEGNKVAVQEHVERFHNLADVSCCCARRVRILQTGTGSPGHEETHNGEAEDEGVETSPWVALGCLPYTLLVLVVLTIKGIMQEIHVVQNVYFGI